MQAGGLAFNKYRSAKEKQSGIGLRQACMTRKIDTQPLKDIYDLLIFAKMQSGIPKYENIVKGSLKN